MARLCTLIAAIACSLAGLIQSAAACSIFYDPEPYEDRMDALREPSLANHVREAAGIYLAKVSMQDYRQIPGEVGEEEIYGDWAGYTGTRYVFDVIETIKGPNRSSLDYRQLTENNYYAIPILRPNGEIVVDVSPSFYSDSQTFWRDWNEGLSLWGDAPLPIGEVAGGLGDCLDYVYFVRTIAYLIVLDEQGRVMSAVGIPNDDSAWLLAVRHFVENPQADRTGSITVREYVEKSRRFDLIEVKRCGRAPFFERTDMEDGTTREYRPTEEWWFKRGRDPYKEFPFTRAECKTGAQFVKGRSEQMFAVTGDGMIDFRDIVLQAEISDPQFVRLSVLQEWISEDGL